MRTKESGHRLIELFRQKFGEHIPLIRRQGVKGFVRCTPVWPVRQLGLDTVRKQASAIEVETRRFYERAAARAKAARIRQLLDDCAQEERHHGDRAQGLTTEKLRPDVKEDEDKARRRLFVLQIVQPGLAGLMDGSVSTLAPVLAAALATKNSGDTFWSSDNASAKPMLMPAPSDAGLSVALSTSGI
jgi:rubrerythrin